jgi:hypothetical protein
MGSFFSKCVSKFKDAQLSRFGDIPDSGSDESLLLPARPPSRNDTQDDFEVENSNHSHFLWLPIELRTQVYRHLLHSADWYIGIVSEWDGRQKFLKRVGNDRIKFPIHPQILAVNHQVHDEAAEVLYGDNRFLLMFPGTLTSESLPRYFHLIKHMETSLLDLSNSWYPQQWPQHLRTLTIYHPRLSTSYSDDQASKERNDRIFYIIRQLRENGLQSVVFDASFLNEDPIVSDIKAIMDVK